MRFAFGGFHVCTMDKAIFGMICLPKIDVWNRRAIIALHLILIIWFSNGAQPPGRTPFGKAQGIKKKSRSSIP